MDLPYPLDESSQCTLEDSWETDPELFHSASEKVAAFLADATDSTQAGGQL